MQTPGEKKSSRFLDFSKFVDVRRGIIFLLLYFLVLSAVIFSCMVFHGKRFFFHFVMSVSVARKTHLLCKPERVEREKTKVEAFQEMLVR